MAAAKAVGNDAFIIKPATIKKFPLERYFSPAHASDVNFQQHLTADTAKIFRRLSDIFFSFQIRLFKKSMIDQDRSITIQSINRCESFLK
jgi:hypothetical protein